VAKPKFVLGDLCGVISKPQTKQFCAINWSTFPLVFDRMFFKSICFQHFLLGVCKNKIDQLSVDNDFG
jgi:hypothetical protein